MIDGLPAQPKDFKIWLDSIYKNPMDNTTETVLPAGAARTTAIIEYGDGTFGELYNEDHPTGVTIGQKAMAVVTTYYDTIDKPRGTIRPFNTDIPLTESTVSSNNVPVNKLLKLIPYAKNTILYDNVRKKLKDTFFTAMAYKNTPGVIGIYYNENADKYFSTLLKSGKMWMYNLNTTNKDSTEISLVRRYNNEKLYYSVNDLVDAYSKYNPKRDHLNYLLTGSSSRYKNAFFIKINGSDNTEKNIFLSLLPLISESSYRISSDSTTSVTAIFFNDDSLFSQSNIAPITFSSSKNPLYNDMTEQRVSLLARDPNSLKSNPYCIKYPDQAFDVQYTLAFMNDGAGTANDIKINLVPNSKIDLSTIHFYSCKIGTKIFTNIPKYVWGPTPPQYYQEKLCPYTLSNGIVTTKPCIQVVFKDVNLRGTFQTPLSEIEVTKGKTVIGFTTNAVDVFPEMTASVYFNDATVPITIKRKMIQCPPNTPSAETFQ